MEEISRTSLTPPPMPNPRTQAANMTNITATVLFICLSIVDRLAGGPCMFNATLASIVHHNEWEGRLQRVRGFCYISRYPRRSQRWQRCFGDVRRAKWVYPYPTTACSSIPLPNPHPLNGLTNSLGSVCPPKPRHLVGTFRSRTLRQCVEIVWP